MTKTARVYKIEMLIRNRGHVSFQTLLEELEVTLENPAGRQDEPGSRSRDDDMDKLLGELSGPRRT